MNQSFSLALNGSCVDQKEEPNAPVLDDGMIPVVFDTTNGTVVKTVSSTDSSWYDYSNQEWAARTAKTAATMFHQTVGNGEEDGYSKRALCSGVQLCYAGNVEEYLPYRLRQEISR